MFVGFTIVSVLCSSAGCVCVLEKAVTEDLYPEYSYCVMQANKLNYPLLQGESLECVEVERNETR